MKRAQAFLILLAMVGLIAVQGCERSTGDQLKSDLNEAGNDLNRGVKDAVD